MKFYIIFFVLISSCLLGQDAPKLVIHDKLMPDTIGRTHITGYNFNHIKSCKITITYDETKALATAVIKGAYNSFPVWLIDLSTPGIIIINASTNDPDGETISYDMNFCWLEFEIVSYGQFDILFDNSLEDNCWYIDNTDNLLDDTTIEDHYVDATFEFYEHNAPISTIGDLITNSSYATIPIVVSNAWKLGACDLEIYVDPIIAKITSAELAPGIEAYLYAFYVSPDDGKCQIMWLWFEPFDEEGYTLPDNTTFINLTIQRVNYGSSDISFSLDHYLKCHWYNWDFEQINDRPEEDYYINGSVQFNQNMIHAPISTISNVSTSDQTTTVDIKVKDFISIGAFNYRINYDKNTVKAESVELGEGISYISFNGSVNAPGVVAINFISEIGGLTLSDETVIATITFSRLKFGTSYVNFNNDLPANCSFSDALYDELGDVPYSEFYIDGSVNFLQSTSCGGF